MIEKSLIIMMFMYSTSFAVLGTQFVLADVFNLTLVSPITGAEIESNLLDIIDIDQLNTSTEGLVNTNQTQLVDDPVTTAAEVTLEIFLLLTGTYVFNILILLAGIPNIWVAGFVILYFILLFRTIIAYLRGI